MASLSDLSPEIVLEILNYVEPFDLHSFTYVSKNLYTLAKDRLAEHRKLLRKQPAKLIEKYYYSNVASLTLLIIKHPRFAHYVKHLELQQFGMDTPSKFTILAPAVLALFKQKFQVLTGVGSDHPLLEHFDQKLVETMLVLLVLLLPRLKTLNLRQSRLGPGSPNLLPLLILPWQRSLSRL